MTISALPGAGEIALQPLQPPRRLVERGYPPPRRSKLERLAAGRRAQIEHAAALTRAEQPHGQAGGEILHPPRALGEAGQRLDRRAAR